VVRAFDLALSRSSVAVLAPKEGEAILSRISSLWRHPELRGQGAATLGYVTRVRRCRGPR
jgi:hypothetical protein